MSINGYFDESDSDEEAHDVKILKQSFDLKDFLNFGPTRQILEQEYEWKFDCDCDDALDKFFRNEVNYCQASMSTLFNNEIDYEHMGIFKNLVFNNLMPNYDLEVFYNNPQLAKTMVQSYEERQIAKEKQRLAEIRKNYENSKNAGKKFDWGTRTYK